MLAVLDTGPLDAAADEDDQDHKASLEVLQALDLRLFVPAMVVAETTYLVESRLGPVAEARFLAGMEDFEVVAPSRHEWARISELVRRYSNFPLGGTDASVIALAERLNIEVIVTLDRRHFAAVRPLHVTAFRLLPE